MNPYCLYIPCQDLNDYDKYNIVNIHSASGQKFMIGFRTVKELADAYFNIYKDSTDILIYDPSGLVPCVHKMVGNYFCVVDENDFLICKLSSMIDNGSLIQAFKKD